MNEGQIPEPPLVEDGASQEQKANEEEKSVHEGESMENTISSPEDHELAELHQQFVTSYENLRERTTQLLEHQRTIVEDTDRIAASIDLNTASAEVISQVQHLQDISQKLSELTQNLAALIESPSTAVTDALQEENIGVNELTTSYQELIELQKQEQSLILMLLNIKLKLQKINPQFAEKIGTSPDAETVDRPQASTEQLSTDYFSLALSQAETLREMMDEYPESNREAVDQYDALKSFEPSGDPIADAQKFLHITGREHYMRDSLEGPASTVPLYKILSELRPLINDMHFDPQSESFLNREFLDKPRQGDLSDEVANRLYFSRQVIHAQELRVLDSILEGWHPDAIEKSARLDTIAEKAEGTLKDYKARAEEHMQNIESIEQEATLLRADLPLKYGICPSYLGAVSALNTAFKHADWLKNMAAEDYLNAFDEASAAVKDMLAKQDTQTLTPQDIEGMAKSLEIQLSTLEYDDLRMENEIVEMKKVIPNIREVLEKELSK